MLLIAWLASATSIWLTAELLPGFRIRNGLRGAVLVAAVLGLLRALLGYVLVLAIGIGTLGLGFLLRPLTEWLVTTLLLVLTDKLSDTLHISSFGQALVGALVMTVAYELQMGVVRSLL